MDDSDSEPPVSGVLSDLCLDEVRHILTFLDPHSLYVAGLVCQHLREAALTEYVWNQCLLNDGHPPKPSTTSGTPRDWWRARVDSKQARLEYHTFVARHWATTTIPHGTRVAMKRYHALCLCFSPVMSLFLIVLSLVLFAVGKETDHETLRASSLALSIFSSVLFLLSGLLIFVVDHCCVVCHNKRRVEEGRRLFEAALFETNEIHSRTYAQRSAKERQEFVSLRDVTRLRRNRCGLRRQYPYLFVLCLFGFLLASVLSLVIMNASFSMSIDAWVWVVLMVVIWVFVLSLLVLFWICYYHETLVVRKADPWTPHPSRWNHAGLWNWDLHTVFPLFVVVIFSSVLLLSVLAPFLAFVRNEVALSTIGGLSFLVVGLSVFMCIFWFIIGLLLIYGYRHNDTLFDCLLFCFTCNRCCEYSTDWLICVPCDDDSSCFEKGRRGILEPCCFRTGWFGEHTPWMALTCTLCAFWCLPFVLSPIFVGVGMFCFDATLWACCIPLAVGACCWGICWFVVSVVNRGNGVSLCDEVNYWFCGVSVFYPRGESAVRMFF